MWYNNHLPLSVMWYQISLWCGIIHPSPLLLIHHSPLCLWCGSTHYYLLGLVISVERLINQSPFFWNVAFINHLLLTTINSELPFISECFLNTYHYLCAVLLDSTYHDLCDVVSFTTYHSLCAGTIRHHLPLSLWCGTIRHHLPLFLWCGTPGSPLYTVVPVSLSVLPCLPLSHGPS